MTVVKILFGGDKKYQAALTLVCERVSPKQTDWRYGEILKRCRTGVAGSLKMADFALIFTISLWGAAAATHRQRQRKLP